MFNQQQKTLSFLLITTGFISLILFIGAGRSRASAESHPQPPSAVPPDGWTVECIDCPRYFTAMSGNSAALDSNGRIHTAYGGDSLYYATENPDGTFQTEVVDANPNRGLNATMVLDSSDHPHILYYAADLLRLNHAHHDGAQWHIESLPTADLNALPHPWLVIDSSDNLHLAYIEGDGLIYSFYHNNSWQFTTVDTDVSGNIGRPSLDLDSSGRPHIAYGRGGKYAYFDGLEWQITTFPGTYSYGESIALALDGSNRPHILYQTDFDGDPGFDVRYRYYNGSSWQIEDVDLSMDEIGFNVGYDISLVFAGNEPAAVYSVELWSGSPYPSYNLFLPRLAIREENGWQFRKVQWNLEPIFDMNYPTILSGSGNDLILIYKVAHELKSAVFVNNTFTIDIIETGGDSGRYLDVSVDSQDRLHISAHESEGFRVRYGLKSQENWTVETPAFWSGVAASPWTSLALSNDDRPYIMYDAYQRVAHMPYVYFDGQGWVDATYYHGEGLYYDIGMGFDDVLHLTFKQGQSDILKHVSRDTGGKWSEETTVDYEMVEGRPDVVVNKYNFPHIVYPATDGLRYAAETPSGWFTQTVVLGNAIDYPSLALDRYNRPHIAWYDTVEQALRYAAFDGSAWQVTTIDSGGDVGQYPSRVVDRLGRVYISYYDATNQDLKYATYDGSAWTTATLLSEGDVGSYSKLVMPYAGYPAIAYYDATARDLMLIHRPFLPTHFAHLPVLP